MSFCDKVFNGIPVVGHVKGFFHYALGDDRSGDMAIEAANRTSAVMIGGALGAAGGPAGIIAGAAGAGALMDASKSVREGSPQGVIAGLDDVFTGLAHGSVPVLSIIKTGVFVGADIASGFGGGSIAGNLGGSLAGNIGGSVASSAAKDTAVVVAKNAVGCQLAAAGSLGRGIAEEAPRSRPPSSKVSSSGSSSSTPKSGKSSTSTSSGSGSQPPREPNKGGWGHEKDQGESHLDAFLRLFDVASLDDVVIRGIHLFRNLLPGQVKTLKKLIKQLRLNGSLTRIIETVRNLLNKLDIHHVTFQNFLSMSQFVSEYLAEQAAQRCEGQRVVERTTSYEERREQNLNDAGDEAERQSNNPTILTTLKDLYDEISRFSSDPNFRNIYSAIYHYYKHKLVPQTDRVLSVSNYYYLIQKLLERVKSLLEYSQLIDPNHSRRELVFDRIFNVFGRLVRVRIVTKVQDGNLELSSCYILDDDKEYEDEGEEFIDPDKDRS